MKSPNEIREGIIEAAEELFARYGYRKTSVDDVARAARIGKGSIYLHFRSKEELFAEIVRRLSDRSLDTLQRAVWRASTPSERLRTFIETRLYALSEITPQVRFGDDTLIELIPMAAPHRQVHFARERSLLLELLLDGVSCGAFALERPESLATGIMAWLDSSDAVAASRREDPAVRGGVGELVSVLLRGLGAAPPSRTTRDRRG